jgi:hypothetical protein
MSILNWERVDKDEPSIARAKVPGGWLVREHFDVAHIGPELNEYITTGYDWRATMCFVPDPHHAWGSEPTPFKKYLKLAVQLLLWFALGGFALGLLAGWLR